jgi:hypothetical protein
MNPDEMHAHTMGGTQPPSNADRRVWVVSLPRRNPHVLNVYRRRRQDGRCQSLQIVVRHRGAFDRQLDEETGKRRQLIMAERTYLHIERRERCSEYIGFVSGDTYLSGSTFYLKSFGMKEADGTRVGSLDCRFKAPRPEASGLTCDQVQEVSAGSLTPSDRTHADPCH